MNILIGLAKFLKHQKSDDKYFIINLEGVEVNLKELSKVCLCFEVIICILPFAFKEEVVSMFFFC